MGNHGHYKSDIQCRGEIWKGEAGEAVRRLKIEQTTEVAQPKEVIDVEISSHFSFRVEQIENRSLKKNQSKAGM